MQWEGILFFTQLYDLVSPAHEFTWEQAHAGERMICKQECLWVMLIAEMILDWLF